MNDIILSGLLNLFALCGTEGKTDKQKSLGLVEAHLKGFYGLRNPQSYLNLFSDLRDYYDDFPELDHTAITDGICSQLKSRISRTDQQTLLLRLMEFCAVLSGAEVPRQVFGKVAEGFGIDDVDGMSKHLRKHSEEEARRIAEEEERAAERRDRRDRYYGNSNSNLHFKRRPQIFRFRNEDLDNEDVILAVENTPTYKRTKQALKEIQSISTGSSQEETDTPREDISGKISFV